MEISRPWKYPWGGPWKFPWAQMLQFCTWVGFFVTNAKLSAQSTMYTPLLTNHDIIGTGFSRHLKAGQKHQFVTQKRKKMVRKS